MNSDNKILVKNYRTNPTLESFTEAVCGNVELPFCKMCGKHVWYPTTLIRYDRNRDGIKIDTSKPSSISFKSIFGAKYYLRVCYFCLGDNFSDLKNKNISRLFNTLNEICCFAYDIPFSVREKFNSSKKFTLEFAINKYGETEGKKKWKSYCDKQSLTNTYEYKKEKYGWSEKDFEEFNKSRGVTLENMTKKHGEELGQKLYDSYVDKQKTNGKTIEWFITKYGVDQGTLEYETVCLKKIVKPVSGKNISVSKVSQEFFKQLDNYINLESIYYDKNGYEFLVKIEDISKFYYLDYYLPEINVAIEFCGDFYHANPEIYKNPDQILKIFKKTYTVKEVWEKDNIRIENLHNFSGIRVIKIWERDFRRRINDQEFYNEIVSTIMNNDGK